MSTSDSTMGPVSLSDHGTFAVVSLNSPRQLNCLDQAMLTGLERALKRFEGHTGYRALVVTGSGGVFSVGADLNTIASLDTETAFAFAARGQQLMARLNHPGVVTIAAVDGFCIGGGLDLALSCDLRYATARSSFQHPGVNRGIITGWGGNVRLPQLIGKDAARRYFMTAARIDAAEALRLGLINGIVVDAREHACQIATQISTNWTAGLIDLARQRSPEVPEC